MRTISFIPGEQAREQAPRALPTAQVPKRTLPRRGTDVERGELASDVRVDPVAARILEPRLQGAVPLEGVLVTDFEETVHLRFPPAERASRVLGGLERRVGWARRHAGKTPRADGALDAASVRRELAVNEPKQRRLAATVPADKRRAPTRVDDQIKTREDVLLRAVVAERQPAADNGGHARHSRETEGEVPGSVAHASSSSRAPGVGDWGAEST